MGYGRTSRLHTTKILRLSEDLPILIDIVDAPDRIDAFIGAAEPMPGICLVTLEPVKILRYGHDAGLD
jgi:PII-like signaling protein